MLSQAEISQVKSRLALAEGLQNLNVSKYTTPHAVSAHPKSQVLQIQGCRFLFLQNLQACLGFAQGHLQHGRFVNLKLCAIVALMCLIAQTSPRWAHCVAWRLSTAKKSRKGFLSTQSSAR